jgi:hypothetical protein
MKVNEGIEEVWEPDKLIKPGSTVNQSWFTGEGAD